MFLSKVFGFFPMIWKKANVSGKHHETLGFASEHIEQKMSDKFLKIPSDILGSRKQVQNFTGLDMRSSWTVCAVFDCAANTESHYQKVGD